MTDAEASTLPIAALTPWFALREIRGLKAGDSILVQGTGGVAIFAIQLASALGARVIVTSSSDEKLLRARQLGATDTINYRTTPDWATAVLELTDGQGVDVVLDVIWHQTHIQEIAVGHLRSFQDLVRFLDVHTIQPVVDSTFAVEDAQRAYEKLAEGAFGKIVINIA